MTYGKFKHHINRRLIIDHPHYMTNEFTYKILKGKGKN